MPMLFGLPIKQAKGPMYPKRHHYGEGIWGCVFRRIDFLTTTPRNVIHYWLDTRNRTDFENILSDGSNKTKGDKEAT
jgi:hypothetical protein